MEDRKELKRAIAVPVFNTVLLPGVTTVIRLGEHDHLLLKKLASEEVAVALPFKQPLGNQELSISDFCNLGVSFFDKAGRERRKGGFLRSKNSGSHLRRISFERKGRIFGRLPH